MLRHWRHKPRGEDREAAKGVTAATAPSEVKRVDCRDCNPFCCKDPILTVIRALESES